MTTTLGREIIRSKLPDKYKGRADSVLDKKAITKLMTEIALEDPDGYINVLQDLNNVGQSVVSTYGRDAALSFADMKISRKVQSLNDQLRQLIDKTLNDGSLSSVQKEERIKEYGYKYSDKVQALVFEDHNERNTALANQINSGSRGNKRQLMQLGFGNMLMKDALNRDIPFIAVDPYANGIRPMTYWVSASSGRKGFYDVQAATGQSGYLGKQVTAATHGTTIETDDCGTTDTGMPFPADSDKNIGAVLLRPFKNHPAGSVVTEKMVAEAEEGDEMILRSPTTCKCKYGVCAKCSGVGENGKFPATGEYVAMNAARTFVESMTQGGLGCLHPGTPVRMADWSVKTIKDIKVGDLVMGVDMDGMYSPAKVTCTFDHGPQDMMISLFKTPDGDAELLSTVNHKVLRQSGSEAVVAPVGTLEEGCDIYRTKKDNTTYVCKMYQQKSIGKQQALDIEVENESHLFLLANGLVVSNSKHVGGVGGSKTVDPEGADQPTGFSNIERMFMSPASFPGGAVLAPADGFVSSIQKAAQGGTYVTVGKDTLYCSPERTVKVKPGDKVYAGDVLTNGVPSPRELMELKGVGAGRRYFTIKMNEMLKKQGWPTDRRNVEAFTRSMISKVRITDPDGYKHYLPGDIADYNEILANYEPREGSQELDVDKAVNKYLEKPVLYHSVGTRITPVIASELKKYKFDKVLVSDKEPPFKPQFLRPAVVLQNDKNWLPRLAGERLRDGLFDAAQKGITDSYDSTSYVDKIVAAPFKP